MPTGNLPESGKKLHKEVYDKALKGSCKGDKECAARVAWKAVKNAGWRKGADGQWHKSADLQEFSLRIDKAIYDKVNQEMRWKATASDTDEDKGKDNMTLELFSDFIERINSKEQVPEVFRSDFWSGGLPYVSISHYPDYNGKGVPGIADGVYVDGNAFKSKGKFFDNQLGKACFGAICDDLYGENRDNDNKIRISIAFLDYAHEHKSNGYQFVRKEMGDICPECLLELITGKGEGKIFKKGHLIHLALTRVPMNERTSMEVDKAMATMKEDATSIVGEELADELDELKELEVGKSETLVIKAEEAEPEPIVEESQHEDCPEGDEECQDKMKEQQKSLVEEKAVTKKESWGNESSGSYLVVEDSTKPTTWHLPVKKHGKLDHGLMGAAKAALTSAGGHRGNKYSGPKKSEAISKLKSYYKSEGLDWESKAELDDIKSIVKAVLSEMEQEKEPTQEHILDKSLSEFKASFDTVMESELAGDDRLRAIQEPFNKVAERIREQLTVSAPKAEVKAEVEGISELREGMATLTQQIGLLVSQMQTQNNPRKSVIMDAPQRRSMTLPPFIPQIQEAQQNVEVVKSETPKLRAIINRTTQ